MALPLFYLVVVLLDNRRTRWPTKVVKVLGFSTFLVNKGSSRMSWSGSGATAAAATSCTGRRSSTWATS
jgi:hypothetical protein